MKYLNSISINLINNYKLYIVNLIEKEKFLLKTS